MKTHSNHQAREGMALMIVMIAIFVLAAIVGAFAFAMKVETRLAMNAQDQSQDLWLGRSGVELARWVLGQSMACPYSALTQRWAGGMTDDCDTNGPLANVTLNGFPVGERRLSIQITDLESKININTADQQLLQQALTVVGVDASEISGISAAIQDWVDKDDLPKVGGAESDYYQTLVPPYFAKNGPMDDLTELLLVRGVTPEMYWGPFATNHVEAAFQRRNRWGRIVETPHYPVGLVQLFTPFSSGRVNLNTTSAEVLQALGLDENSADELIRDRQEAPFHSMGEAQAKVPPQYRPIIDRYCQVRSRTFQVEVSVEGSNRRFYAILGCNSPRDIQILSFWWKDL